MVPFAPGSTYPGQFEIRTLPLGGPPPARPGHRSPRRRRRRHRRRRRRRSPAASSDSTAIAGPRRLLFALTFSSLVSVRAASASVAPPRHHRPAPLRPVSHAPSACAQAPMKQALAPPPGSARRASSVFGLRRGQRHVIWKPDDHLGRGAEIERALDQSLDLQEPPVGLLVLAGDRQLLGSDTRCSARRRRTR